VKALPQILTAALTLSFAARPAISQDKPQQDGQTTQATKKITRIKMGGNQAEKMLKVKVKPVYPQEARDKRVQGTVRLHAVITVDGSLTTIEVLSGDPLLVDSALAAVHQWKYRPTLLNGEPVEVDTTIDIVYSLKRMSTADRS
jgi:TonB family protein